MCYNLEDVVLPRQQKYIPDMAFYYCKSLKQIDIPSTVRYIGDRAFVGCESYDMGGCKRSLQGFETYEKATDLCIPVIRSVVDKYGSHKIRRSDEGCFQTSAL